MFRKLPHTRRLEVLLILRIGLWIVLGLFCAFFNMAAFAEPTPGNSLSAMSINMWHKDRPHELKIMADQLKLDLKKLPDFILCQEVVFGRGEPEPDTARVLANLLGYQSRGTKRKSDREGIAIISKYPFAFYDKLHLKSQTSFLLLGFKRVSVMGEFVVPGIGRVRVVDVHLTNWEFEGHVRRHQIEETLQWIADREKQVPAAVTLLGGDFNAKRNWGEMDQIAKAAPGGIAFRDFNGAEPSMGAPNPHKRIDFIFISSKTAPQLLRETLFWKDGLRDGGSRFYISDHLAVLHDYQLAAPPAAVTTSGGDASSGSRGG